MELDPKSQLEDEEQEQEQEASSEKENPVQNISEKSEGVWSILRESKKYLKIIFSRPN